MIKPGTGVIQRKHGKNYIAKQADARLKEVVRPYQEQGLRALQVDSFEVKYYTQARGTTTCTCKRTELLPQHSSLSTNLPPTLIGREATEADIRIDYNRPLFGASTESLTANDETDLDELSIDEDVDDHTESGPSVDSMFSSSADCGICYRTGYVPGYNLYGYERAVLTTHSLIDSYGFNIDLHTAPHTLLRLDPTGYVEFQLEVPRYFQSASVSVRNNTKVLDEFLFVPDSHSTLHHLTTADLQAVAGKTIKVRVTAEEFTHAVVEFDLGVDRVLSNVAQMSKTVDWTLFSTLGNLQIILPMTIAEVQAGDLVYIPKRNITLKVTDVTFLRTVQERNLDWSVNTRVLQPQESLKYIFKANRLP